MRKPFSQRIWDPAFPFNPARAPVFYGWVIVAASTVGMLASMPGQTVGVGVYTDTYLEILGLDRIQLTTAYLLGTGLSGFLVATGGTYFDRLGARRFFVVASLLFAASLLFMSQIDRLSGFLGGHGSFVVATGVASVGFLGIRFFGQGMVTLGSRSMLSKWWNLRRGRMVSISGIFISFGFSISPRVLDWEIQAFGWRGSLLLNAAILAIVITLFGWLFYRDNPEECGLEMDNGWKPDKRPENPDTLLGKEFTRREAMGTYSFWIITLALGFHGLFATAYTFHIIDIGRVSGVPRETILNFFIYASFLSVSTNFVVGFITDYIRLRYVISLFAACGLLFTAGILLLPGLPGVVILIIGMGCCGGIFPILSTVAFPRYFGRAHIGAINGAALAGMVWGSAVGPLAFSLGKNLSGDYSSIVWLSAGVYMLLAIGGLFATNPSRKARA